MSLELLLVNTGAVLPVLHWLSWVATTDGDEHAHGVRWWGVGFSFSCRFCWDVCVAWAWHPARSDLLLVNMVAVLPISRVSVGGDFVAGKMDGMPTAHVGGVSD